MRETQLVETIRRLAKTPITDLRLIRGIGDDCAILRPKAGEDLVFTADFLLEGRHFTLDRYAPAAIGHQALARSLSDLAAMGAEPVFCLVSLAVPARMGASFIKGFYKGFLRLAERHGIALAGGDLARFDQVIVDVTCCGHVPKSRSLLRSAAKAGHAIYVTGKLGAAARAFESGGKPVLANPRIEAGIALRKLGAAAAIDLSDGLSLDLARLCVESKVGAELDGVIPVAPRATLDQALHGGEDYELLFTARPAVKIPSSIDGVQISRIGSIIQGRGIRLNGKPLRAKGFDHFA